MSLEPDPPVFAPQVQTGTRTDTPWNPSSVGEIRSNHCTRVPDIDNDNSLNESSHLSEGPSGRVRRPEEDRRHPSWWGLWGLWGQMSSRRVGTVTTVKPDLRRNKTPDRTRKVLRLRGRRWVIYGHRGVVLLVLGEF